MKINMNTIVSMTEANQNFLKVARIAEKNGKAIIFENNKPKFVVLDIEKSDYFDISDDEKIDIMAARILKKFRPAFVKLAKR